MTVKPAVRPSKVESHNRTGAAVTAVGCPAQGTLQMVNWPVTIDTINHHMRKRNGQKSSSDLGELVLGVLKPARSLHKVHKLH